jgi:ribosome-associated translation inhibitor RaiA
MITSARLQAIQASNQKLQTELEQALARIEYNVQKNKERRKNFTITQSD